MPLATFVFELRAVFKICPDPVWFDFPAIVCPGDSCSVTYFDQFKPIAFSLVKILARLSSLHYVWFTTFAWFWANFTRVQLLLRPASNSRHFLFLWIRLPFILCPVNIV